MSNLTVALRGTAYAATNGTAASSFTLTVPAGTTVGDLLVLSVTEGTNYSLSSPAWTEATGANGLTPNSTGNGRCGSRIYYKFATAGEVGGTSLTFTMSASYDYALELMSFSNVDNTFTPVGYLGDVADSSGSSPPTQGAFTAAAGLSSGCVYIQNLAYASGGINFAHTPGTWTNAADARNTGTQSGANGRAGWAQIANNSIPARTYSGAGVYGGYVCNVLAFRPKANSAPTAPVVTAPNGGETVNSSVTVTWTASTDAESDPITYDIDYSANSGGAWTSITTGVSGTSYSWNTSGLTAGTTYLVRVRAYDGGSYSAYDQSNAVFTIAHNATVNVWNGSAFVAKPVSRWDGASWIPVTAGTLKRWNGSAWVNPS